MTPELSHWLVIAIKAGLFYFVGIPVLILGLVLVLGLVIAFVNAI